MATITNHTSHRFRDIEITTGEGISFKFNGRKLVSIQDNDSYSNSDEEILYELNPKKHKAMYAYYQLTRFRTIEDSSQVFFMGPFPSANDEERGIIEIKFSPELRKHLGISIVYVAT